MSNRIRIQRRLSGGSAGAPSGLKNAELAFNETTKILYYGFSISSGDDAASIIEIGGEGAFVTLGTSQTITGAKVLNGTISGTGIDAYVLAKRLDQFAVPTAAVSLNSQKITNLADPVAATDAANKQYVDSARSGLDVKDSCRVATTANITLSGTQTIDGVAVIAGDRVLVKDQSTASQNGIYVCASGAWSRSTDADTSAEVTSGMYVFVAEGTVNADSGWVLTTDDPITLATTNLAFVQFSGAGQIVAGAGLTKSGNTINAVAGTGIVVNADDIALTGQALALHNLATSGLIARTGAGTVEARTLTAPAAGITVTNGDGISGNPTLVLANDLNALEGLASTGFAVRSATDTWVQRSITVGVSLTVSNGDGVAANPSLNTIQDIRTTASPTFASLGLGGAVAVALGVQLKLSGAFTADASATTTSLEHIGSTLTTAGTSKALVGLQVQPAFTVNHTSNSVFGIWIPDAVVSGSQVPDLKVGLRITAQTGGTTNYAISADGTSIFGSIIVDNLTVNVGGTLTGVTIDCGTF